MNAIRLLVITTLIVAVAAVGAFAATAGGQSSLTASVATSITLSVFTGAVLNFGTVAPSTCSQLGDLSIPTVAIEVRVTSNSPWNVSYASTHPSGRLLNNGNASVNPVEFQADTNITTPTAFTGLTNVPTNWFAANQPAGSAVPVFGAVRWCASANELAGTWSGLIDYLATAP